MSPAELRAAAAWLVWLSNVGPDMGTDRRQTVEHLAAKLSTAADALDEDLEARARYFEAVCPDLAADDLPF